MVTSPMTWAEGSTQAAGCTRGVRHDLVDEARAVRLLRRQEARPHDHLLDPRGTEEVHEARVVLHGEAVPEGAGDGRPEARLGRGDPDVADGGDGEAAAHREALDLRDDGLAHALEPTRPALAVPLVLDPVLRGLE